MKHSTLRKTTLPLSMAQATIKRPKQATPSLRRETDTFVLDHLAWDTTRCLLQHAQSSNHKRAKTRQDGSGQELAQLPTELMDMLRMVDGTYGIVGDCKDI